MKQFGLAGRWNTFTKRAGAMQLRSHYGQLLAECIPSVSAMISVRAENQYIFNRTKSAGFEKYDFYSKFNTGNE